MNLLEDQRHQMRLNRGSRLRFRSPLPAISRSLGGPRPLNPYQVMSCHEQICQSAGGEQAVGVLHQPLASHLREAEDALDDPDGMLDLGAHAGFGSVLRPLRLIDHPLVAVTPVGEVLCGRGMLLDDRCLAPVGLVAPHPCFFPMQQIGQALPCRPRWRQWPPPNE